MTDSLHQPDSDGTKSADAMKRRSQESFKAYIESTSKPHSSRASVVAKEELVNTYSNLLAANSPPSPTTQPGRDLDTTPLLPFTATNLAILQEQISKMKLSMLPPTSAAMAISPPAQAVDVNADAEMQSDRCSTPPDTHTESDAATDMHVSRNNQNSIFCCVANKIICMGPGVDDGDNREVIQRFIKNVAYGEERYLSKEDIKEAFLACKVIIEVQRSVEERTQTRYFVPSLIYKKRYVEVHPRDMFYSNPLSRRNDHAFMFVKCWDPKHKKKWVARRVSLLDKPHFLNGTEVYRESEGKWFVSGVVEDWGEVWVGDDE